MRRIDGELISDATMRLRIDVTKQDIQKGTPLNSNACAIAVACRRQLPDCEDVFIHLGRAYIRMKGKWRRWFVPHYARDEVVAFDRGGKFVPQEIELQPPPVTQLTKLVRAQRGPRRNVAPVRKRIVHRTPEVRESAHANLPERS